MEEIKIEPLPPSVNCETIAILRVVNRASRALGQLKGEISKIPNSQILLDTLVLQEAKDSNEIENIVTTDDEIFQASVDAFNLKIRFIICTTKHHSLCTLF